MISLVRPSGWSKDSARPEAAHGNLETWTAIPFALASVNPHQSGYTNTPVIRIASPPFMPWLATAISKVKVTQHVVLGKNYVLESSFNLQTWNLAGSQFTADDEVITLEFDADVTGRFFRIRQVP